MNIICKNCGNQYSESLKLCPFCGAASEEGGPVKASNMQGQKPLPFDPFPHIQEDNVVEPVYSETDFVEPIPIEMPPVETPIAAPPVVEAPFAAHPPVEAAPTAAPPTAAPPIVSIPAEPAPVEVARYEDIMEEQKKPDSTDFIRSSQEYVSPPYTKNATAVNQYTTTPPPAQNNVEPVVERPVVQVSNVEQVSVEQKEPSTPQKAPVVEKTFNASVVEEHEKKKESEAPAQLKTPDKTKPTENKPKVKDYTKEEFDIESIPYKYQPTSTSSYFWHMLLFCIPIIGFIMMLVYAFGSNSRQDMKNYTRAMLIWMLIGVIISFLIAGAGVFSALSLGRMGYGF